MQDINVHLTTWDASEIEISEVRESVFLNEQGIPAELDFDGSDPACMHVIAVISGKTVGTGRLQCNGKIGRVAVLSEFRMQGVGTALVSALIRHAQHAGIRDIHLNSQQSSVGFYEKLGFRSAGTAFLEAGLPHVRMVFTDENR